MALGMVVHGPIGPSHIVLDGDPAPLPQKGTEPPIFGPFLLSSNGWMDQDGTWYGGGLGPGDFVFDGDHAATPEQGAHPPPSFWPMFIVAKRLDG